MVKGRSWALCRQTKILLLSGFCGMRRVHDMVIISTQAGEWLVIFRHSPPADLPDPFYAYLKLVLDNLQNHIIITHPSSIFQGL